MKHITFTILALLMLAFASAQTFEEIGNGTLSSNLPSFNLWGYSWSSTVYPASSFGGAHTITKLAFHKTNPNTIALNNQKIYLKESPSTTFATMGYESPTTNGYTLVYDGTISASQGWVEIDITDFAYSGNQNLIVHWENRLGTSLYNNDWYATDSPVGTVKCSGSDNSFPTGGGTAPYPQARPNMRFYYNSANPATPILLNPANNALGVALSAPLQFTLGTNTTGYQVWMGYSANSLGMIHQAAAPTSGTYTYQPTNPFTASTQYFWKVVATNASGSSSTTVWNFTTEGSVSVLPYTQGFEGTFPPTGWSANLWTQDTENALSGGACAKASYIHAGAAILSSPLFTLPPTPARMKFWWSDGDWIDARVAGHDTTYCEISTNGGQSWTPLIHLSEPDNQTAYQQAEVNLTAYAGQSVNIRFRDVTDGSISAYGVFLDDFLLEVIPLNSVIHIEPNTLNFGTTVAGSMRTEEVLITNQGTNPLVITGFNCDGPFTASFPDPIAGGQSATVSISYVPSSAGTHASTLSFTISGTFQGDNTVQLSGSAYVPFANVFQNFDASLQMPEYWGTILNVQSTVSYVGVRQSNFDAHSGTNFIKMYNAGDDATNADLILVSPGLTQLSAHSLSFYAKSSWGIATDTMILGTMSDPVDADSFTPLQTYSLTDEYQQFTHTFAINNSDKYFAFKHGLGGAQNYAVYLDDISWEGGGDVPNPANAVYPANAATNVVIKYSTGFTNKSFAWSSTGGNPTGYKFFYGFTPLFEFFNGFDLGNVSTYMPEIELEYNTMYYWKIVPYNADGDALNCPTFSFTTMADPTVQISYSSPFSDSFEQCAVGYMPLGWEMENLNNDTAIWSAIANSTSSQNAHTGNQAMHMAFGFSTPHNDWMYTPPLQLIGNREYSLSFWYKSVPFSGENTVEKMEVKWGNMPSADAMVNNLFYNDAITNATYTQSSHSFTPNTSGKYFVGFHAFSEPVQFVLLVDDVTVSLSTPNEDLVNSAAISISSYPNPFSVDSRIAISSKTATQANVHIYNAKGQLVRQLASTLEKGNNEVLWDGKDESQREVSAGLYFCKVKADGIQQSIKLLKVK